MRLTSAKGAISLLAWGNAPGFEPLERISAESAIHFRREFDHHSPHAAIAE